MIYLIFKCAGFFLWYLFLFYDKVALVLTYNCVVLSACIKRIQINNEIKLNTSQAIQENNTITSNYDYHRKWKKKKVHIYTFF